jgi:adenylate cyclase
MRWRRWDGGRAERDRRGERRRRVRPAGRDGVERRLAAILAADVVGYSRLTERDEAGTFARLMRLRRELVEPVLERHGGHFVDLKGDGAVVELQSAVAAVEAAVATQRAMLDQAPELPEDRRVRYRIGINLGEVIVDGGTIHGDGVNVAARIESLREPGGVWLSRSVYNQVKGKVDSGSCPRGCTGSRTSARRSRRSASPSTGRCQ